MLNGIAQKHAKTYNFDFEFINKVVNCFHVDDFSGVQNSFKKAFELYKKLKLRFIEGLFLLRKWRANYEKWRHLINEKDDEIHPCKILGLLWNEKNDTLCFDFSDIIELSRSLEPSKRNVLQILAMFYDPLGVLQPILFSLKVLFQNLCNLKFEWDDSISDEFKSEWGDILSYLGNVKTIEIPRKILNHGKGDPPQRVELQGFSDASQQSYGACIYLKSIFKGVFFN